MFEVGWTEMLVIAVVMIVVVGPKDLPQMLRQFGRTTAKLRGMAGDFRKQFDEALKEAELDDVKQSVNSLRSLDPTAEIRKQLNPFQQAAQDVRAGLETAMKPKPSVASEPASPVAHTAEPLKNGPAELPTASAPPAPDAFAVPARSALGEPSPAPFQAAGSNGSTSSGAAPSHSVEAVPAKKPAARKRAAAAPKDGAKPATRKRTSPDAAETPS